MADYIIPAGRGEAEYIDKRSRFIGQVIYAPGEAEAMAFVESVRRRYGDATHNVWAYTLSSGAMRWSDDGEPGGTAGQPVLNVFRSAGVVDACCVVTRDFGGKLLGSGGLVRAYSKAAAMALEAAGRARMAEWRVVSTDCGYPQYERVRRLLEDLGAAEIQAAFAAGVSVSALLPVETAETYAARLGDVTAGSARCSPGGSVFRPQKIISEK